MVFGWNFAEFLRIAKSAVETKGGTLRGWEFIGFLWNSMHSNPLALIPQFYGVLGGARPAAAPSTPYSPGILEVPGAVPETFQIPQFHGVLGGTGAAAALSTPYSPGIRGVPSIPPRQVPNPSRLPSAKGY